LSITIDWVNKIINVPKSYTSLIQLTPFEIRELDIDSFRLDLKSLEDDPEGMPWVRTHIHTAPVNVGGAVLARVVEIINDYTITFEDGQYAVNIVGGNSNIGDVVNVNQVSVRSANSAGLTFSKEIQDQSYADTRIWINTLTGASGEAYPLGTPGSPVNNYSDAFSILSNRSLARRFHLTGDITSLPSDDFSSTDWVGLSKNLSVIRIVGGTDITNSKFKEVSITGELSDNHVIEDSIVYDVVDFNGDVFNSGLRGIISFPTGASSRTYTFSDCYSMDTGASALILNCNGASDLNVQFRKHSGETVIINYTDASNNMTFDMTDGELTIDSSCTAGVIVVRGTGAVNDNSAGTTVVKHVAPEWTEAEKNATVMAISSIADTVALLQKYQENRSVIDTTNNTLIIYDDDDVTPILAFSLLDSTGTPSTLEVAEKLPI
jgi:hypothetical protein